MDTSTSPLPGNPQPIAPGRSPRTVRALGWLLIVLGPCLSGGMAFIANWLHQAILHSHDPGTASRWHGGVEFTRTAFELFGAVFLFGLVAFSTGIYQASTGRRNRPLATVMLLLVGVMAYLGYRIVTTTPTP